MLVVNNIYKASIKLYIILTIFALILMYAYIYSNTNEWFTFTVLKLYCSIRWTIISLQSEISNITYIIIILYYNKIEFCYYSENKNDKWILGGHRLP